MRVIAGTARSIPLETPEGMSTRPTTDRVKESVFSALQFEIEGRTVLDLFAGSGQLGIEALSRGAKQAVFIDADRKAVEVVRKNLKKTKFEDRSQVFNCTAEAFLRKTKTKFDLIFLDPPYAQTLLEEAVDMICRFDILTPGGIIVAEMPKDKDVLADDRTFSRSKPYGFGVSKVILFRKEQRL